MAFRFWVLIILLLSSFCQLKAQTIGAYGSTFYSSYNDYIFGPGAGIFANGFLKGQFNPGIDIQYTKCTEKLIDQPFLADGTRMGSSSGDTYNSDMRASRSITALNADMEFTSPQEDTFVISFGLQAGGGYLQENFYFTNPDINDVYLKTWVPSLGGSGTIRRNYIFGSPFQLFFSISYQSYFSPKLRYREGAKTMPFQYNANLTVGYAKLGLAYKL